MNQFNESLQWGFGSSLAMLLLLAVFLLLVILRVLTGRVEAAGQYTRAFTPRRSPFLFTYALAMMAFLYAPIAVIVILAFNDSATVGLPLVGFTTRWFANVFNDPVLQDALWTSLQVAGASVLISVVLGTVAAVQLARTRGPLRSLSLGAIAIPLFLPPLVLGWPSLSGLTR